jgi:hypothetical protein
MACYLAHGLVEIVAVIVGPLVRCRLLTSAMQLCHLHELRADGGQPEIGAALTRLAGVYGDE